MTLSNLWILSLSYQYYLNDSQRKILTKLSKFIGRLKRNTLKVKITYVNPNLIIDYWIKKIFFSLKKKNNQC